MRRSFIATAVAAALARLSPPDEAPPSPLAAPETDSAPLDAVRVIPVKPGHPREPRPKRFELDKAAGVCYVREADWPELQAALRKRKGEPGGGR